jgi:hypothetical protein
MPNTFTLTIGATNFDLLNLPNTLGLAGGTAPKDLSPAIDDLNFVLSGALTQFLDTPLSQINSPHNSASLSYNNNNNTWNPSAGIVKFKLGISGSVAASVTVINAGSIFGKDSNGDDIVFYDGFADPKPIAGFTVPPGKAYIATQLSFGIAGNLDASAQYDALGVDANASGKTDYTVTHYKCFDVSAKLRDTLPVALAQFVLPLHAATATNLVDGDILMYDFDGTLQVGFGVNYGINGSLAGHTLQFVPSVGDLGKIISVSASSAPSYTVGANFAVKFSWSRVFQCIVQRTANATENTARLHLFSQDQSERNAQFQAGVLTLSPNTSASVNLNTAQLTDGITRTLLGNTPPPPGFATLMGDATNEIQQYINDVNGYAKKLLTALPNGSTGLSVLIDSLNKNTSCFEYVFNMADPDQAELQNAWNLAMGGDFVGACQLTNAVQLAAGSGLDQFHQKQTTIELLLFGYNLGSSVTTYYDDLSITYAGGGRFVLAAKDGVTYSSTSLSASSSADLYFSATADSTDTTTATNVVITFHGVLTANKNQDWVRAFAAVLNSLGSTTDLQGAADRLNKTYAPSKNAGPFVLHVTFASTAYQKINSSQYVNGNPTPHQIEDENNWAEYVTASKTLQTIDSPASRLAMIAGAKYSDYGNWARFNLALAQSSPPPDRRYFGNSFVLNDALCSSFLGPDTFVAYGNDLLLYEWVGQEFMNFCDDLRAIIRDSSSKPVSWETITTDMKNAKSDIQPWFGPVYVLALALLCGGNIQVQPVWGTAGATLNVTLS